MASVELKVGFIPLCDAAPLVVAKEEGIFEDLGLAVSLVKQRSWATIRDKLAYGELEAAHILSPIIVASALGLSPVPEPFATAMGFNLNGNAITVSNSLYQEMQGINPWAFDARPVKATTLRQVQQRRLEQDQRPITFATVYPFSSHNYLLRYWLAASGIDPDKQMRLIVVPPPDMVSLCRAGEIDGYCVGEPWNTLAVHEGVGHQIVAGTEIWPAAPEKVLGVRSSWLVGNEEVHQQLVRAVMRSLNILKTDEGKDRAVTYLAREDYIGLQECHLRRSLGSCAENGLSSLFDPTIAGFPWHSKAAWTAAQMARWGQLKNWHGLDELLARAFRTDLYRDAAKLEDIRYPLVDDVIEGANPEPWPLDQASTSIAMPADKLIDGRIFDRRDVGGYLASF